jgi:predicted acyltransferase
MAAGAAMHYAGVCPIVKRIWTPSFALFSGGICLITLGLLYALMDIAGWRRWAYPAVVVGANSIAAYALIHLTGEWVVVTVRHHFGDTPYNFLGAEYQPLLENLSVGIFVWLICLWMYRRHIHVRI